MSYKILKVQVQEVGANSHEVKVEQACADLTEQVQAAIADGWEPIGGIHTISRPLPSGHRHWFMQAMRKTAYVFKSAPDIIDVPRSAEPAPAKPVEAKSDSTPSSKKGNRNEQRSNA